MSDEAAYPPHGGGSHSPDSLGRSGVDGPAPAPVGAAWVERALTELSNVFFERDQAILLTRQAGFPRSRTPTFTTPLVFWAQVIEEANNGLLPDGARSIAEKAAELYPNNRTFSALCAESTDSSTHREERRTFRRVFISHAREDHVRVAGLVALLRGLGHRAFVASTSLSPGKGWKDKLLEVLRECEAVVVMWTKAASNSSWVHQEYSLAREQRPDRPLIPLCLDHTELPDTLVPRDSLRIPALQSVMGFIQQEADRERGPLIDDVGRILAAYDVALSRRELRSVLIFATGSMTGLGLGALGLFVKSWWAAVPASPTVVITTAATGIAVGWAGIAAVSELRSSDDAPAVSERTPSAMEQTSGRRSAMPHEPAVRADDLIRGTDTGTATGSDLTTTGTDDGTTGSLEPELGGSTDAHDVEVGAPPVAGRSAQRSSHRRVSTTTPEEEGTEEKPKTTAISKQRLNDIVDEVGKLRTNGDYETAASLLKDTLSQPVGYRTREVLDYELGTLLSNQLSRRREACNHWKRHIALFGSGRYAKSIERIKFELDCEAIFEQKSPAETSDD